MNARKLLSAAKAVEAAYIEDVFSTYLYTGNGSTQTITNGIDLSGKGGLVWTKERSATIGAQHALVDTIRGVNKTLASNSTNPEVSRTDSFNSFNSNGYTLGADAASGQFNYNTATYVSWTFRKQAKFFDVVTYTGSGVETPVNHSLGSVPGFYVVKRINSIGNWLAYHRSLTTAEMILLNSTAAATGNNMRGAAPTATQITPAGDADISGATYVAYLFAHDAGGFGASGSDNVISCGSFTGTGASSGNIINLGYEPQLVMLKCASVAGSWITVDTMRGLSVGTTADAVLRPDLSSAESAASVLDPLATGFEMRSSSSGINGTGETMIYIAIRRGPMKTPTTGTSVFGLNARTGTSANATVTGGAGVTDLAIIKNRSSSSGAPFFASRLTGTGYLLSSSTAAEVAAGTTILQANPWDVMDGIKVGTTSLITNANGNNFINYLIDRAPGFFDVVCYTGTGANRTVTHNLGVAPELLIIKKRTGAPDTNWDVNYGFTSTTSNQFALNLSVAASTNLAYGGATMNAQPTTTTFAVTTVEAVNGNTDTYVAYLFATCPGVSKVGSYTGTGNTLQIDCGFTGGARFVLIKRTDSTGDWYVWDSARGIVAGNDPYLLLNSTAAEVTSTDYVDTYSAGFEISSTAPAAINANGGSFIFLAIA